MSARRALAEREHQKRRARRSRLRRSTVVVVATVMAATALLLIVTDRLYRPGSFPIEQIRLEGVFEQVRPEVLRQRVIKALESNFFALDLEQIRREVETMPWVQRARVRRVWPRGVSVTVEEHRPVARWGKLDFVNSDGDVVRLDERARGMQLVELHGPAGTSGQVLAHYRQWRSLLSQYGLKTISVQMDARFAWSVKVLAESAAAGTQPVYVVLGTEDVERRLRRFLKFYPELTSEEASRLRRADVRYPNGIAVRFAPATDQGEAA